MTYKFTIGADPELFVSHNGKFISAHGMVPGTKQAPHKVDFGAVQVDGMALEFNIDPAGSEDEFQHHIQAVIDQLKGMIGDKEFLKDCSVFFDESLLDEVPAENKILGCEADYNAYTYMANKSPDGGLNMRTAGGHVHIGGFEVEDEWTAEHFGASSDLARAMDRYLGVYSLLWDKDDKRRSMYGKAGSFRPKRYGMEYRTLSNAWLFSKDLVSFVYQQAERAVNSFLNGEVFDETYRDIIDNSDRDHQFFSTDSTALLLKEKLYYA